jgi:hypothetical protein
MADQMVASNEETAPVDMWTRAARLVRRLNGAAYFVRSNEPVEIDIFLGAHQDGEYARV